MSRSETNANASGAFPRDIAAQPPSKATSSSSASNSTFAAASFGEQTFYGHMISGALAGTTEHCAMFPLDTIKTRLQTAGAAGTAGGVHGVGGGATQPGFGPAGALRTVVRGILTKEGVRGLYRGLAAVGLGAGPAHAVYFATYEGAKETFGGNCAGHNPVAHAAAGVCATIVGDAVQNPVDTVKQRLQMAGSPYKSVTDCVYRVMREEGVGALYRSYPTTLVMNIPFTAVHFAVYEGAKRVLQSRWKLEEEGFWVQFTAGGFAGGLASAVTTPLDVVKTRMQTHCEAIECEVVSTVETATEKGVCAIQGDAKRCARITPPPMEAAKVQAAEAMAASPYSSSSVSTVMRTILTEEGGAALFRGIVPRVLFHIPAAAICWATYEASKRYLGIAGDAGIPH